MTPESLRQLEDGFTILFNACRHEFDEIQGWDNEREAIMLGLAECIAAEKRNYDLFSREPHPGVVACLESCIEGLHRAAMDYYASTK